MEQLTTLGGPVTRRTEMARMMEKIKISLSVEQLAALGRVLTYYMANMQVNDIYDQAALLLLYRFSEKARGKMFTTKNAVLISFDLPTAVTLIDMFREVDLKMWPYEYSVQTYIISEIDKQTI